MFVDFVWVCLLFASWCCVSCFGWLVACVGLSWALFAIALLLWLFVLASYCLGCFALLVVLLLSHFGWICLWLWVVYYGFGWWVVAWLFCGVRWWFA